MASKQIRTYFCKPCDERHQAPSNANCTRNRRDDEPVNSPIGENPSAPSSLGASQQGLAQGARPKTTLQSKPGPKKAPTERKGATGKRRRLEHRASTTFNDSDNTNNTNIESEVIRPNAVSLDLIMQILDPLYTEG